MKEIINGTDSDDSEKQSNYNEHSGVTINDLLNEVKKPFQVPKATEHRQLLSKLLEQIPVVNFVELAGFSDKNQLPTGKQILVMVIEVIKDIAERNHWDLCRNQNSIYLYNGKYWEPMEPESFQQFLGEAAEKMGIDKYHSRHYATRDQLFKQFMATGYLERPEVKDGKVLINLENGTFEFTAKSQFLRKPDPKDFLTHLLPFAHAPNAKAPLFLNYLNRVQPDLNIQKILAEFMGYIFMDSSVLKLEKALLLYGNGANGKSVFHEIMTALLGGDKNTSGFSIQSLTNENGYYRAMLANKLVNYASEINGKLEASIFKQLVSGEPVEARLPYGPPFTLRRYGKFIFNCNELPKEVEHTHAFYRRFLIVPWDVTIPEAEQDKRLAKTIIETELAGIFNWILEGLKRLLIQKSFTQSEIVDKQLEQYKMNSDSVQLFLDDNEYAKSVTEFIPLQDLYSMYRSYCENSGYRPCSLKTFSERLRASGFKVERKNTGNVVFTICNLQIDMFTM